MRIPLFVLLTAGLGVCANAEEITVASTSGDQVMHASFIPHKRPLEPTFPTALTRMLGQPRLHVPPRAKTEGVRPAANERISLPVPEHSATDATNSLASLSVDWLNVKRENRNFWEEDSFLFRNGSSLRFGEVAEASRLDSTPARWGFQLRIPMRCKR